MNFYESQDSKRSVSLAALFREQEDISGINPLFIERLAFLVVRRGWPASVGMENALCEKRVRDYVDAAINQDLSRVDNVEKNLFGNGRCHRAS